MAIHSVPPSYFDLNTIKMPPVDIWPPVDVTTICPDSTTHTLHVASLHHIFSIGIVLILAYKHGTGLYPNKNVLSQFFELSVKCSQMPPKWFKYY